MKCTCNTKPRIDHPFMELDKKTRQHPCFSQGAHKKYGRIHLPVAPVCNINCNYCDRRFDCSHESRPGVSSEILTPEAACKRFLKFKNHYENLNVVGIAGPGDPLANWESTRKTIELVSESVPEAVFCLSTNGLMLPAYAESLVDLGVRHITVTVNCLHAAVGSRIYRHVRYHGVQYGGEEGAALLIENQLQGIEMLARKGMVIKVNTVMIPGINDREIPDIVREVSRRKAFISNIMPLIPVPGTAFEHLPPTGERELSLMRQHCQVYLEQMFHCRQCRSDAVGLLGKDLPPELHDGQASCPENAKKKAV